MPRMTPRNRSTEGTTVKNNKAAIGRKNTLILGFSEASTAKVVSSTTPRSPVSSARASAALMEPTRGITPIMTKGTITTANNG